MSLNFSLHMDPQTDALLKRADDDAALLQLSSVPEIPFGQHTQAAIEKLLKALLNERQGTFQRIHDLNYLAAELKKLGESLPPLPVVLGSLNDYATNLRYDDPGNTPLLDRPACMETVRLIRAHVVARIQTLDAGNP